MLDKDQIRVTSKIFLKATQDGNTFLFNALLGPLSEQIDITEIVDKAQGSNALHWAANNGCLEIVKSLAEKFPKLVNSKDYLGITPIRYATLNDHEKIVQYLQQYSDVLNKSFIDAIKNNQQELAAEWLDKGADIETPFQKIDTDICESALFHTCVSGNEQLTKFLIERKANVDFIGAKTKFTPLHAAVYFGNEKIVEILINAGATLSLKDAKDRTSLDIAKERKMQRMITLLEKNTLSTGKDEKPVIIEVDKDASAKDKNSPEIKKTVPDKLDELKKILGMRTKENGTLEERYHNLSEDKNSYVPNSIFSEKLQANSFVTVESLRASINSCNTYIDAIEQAGRLCIKAFNEKYNADFQKMKVKPAKFEKYIAATREAIAIIQKCFCTQNDIVKIKKTITENFGIISAIQDIVGSTSNHYDLLYGTIIPSHEYGRDLNTLFDHMTKLKRATHKLEKYITNIYNDTVELTSESRQPTTQIASFKS